MTKVVLHIGIAVLAFAGASAANAAQVQAIGSAQVQILAPESIAVLGSGRTSNALQNAQKNSSVRRTISRRKVGMDHDGHLMEGGAIVELINVDVE